MISHGKCTAQGSKKKGKNGIENKKFMTDYNETKKKLLDFLNNKENEYMVLATTDNNKVYARTILIANEGFDIYFFTWKYSRKYSHIEKNNHVSLCKDIVQIERTAKILGLMNDKKNERFKKIIADREPTSIEFWKKKPNMEIIKITIDFAIVDGYYENEESFIEYLDIKKGEAYKAQWGNY